MFKAKILHGTLHGTFKDLFETKKHSDITFLVHGKDLQAHKLVLSCRSPVFEAMIASNLMTKNGKFLIEDPKVSYENFVNFLQFLYTDNCQFKKENIEVLLHLSNFYDVKYLSDQCVKNIEISDKNDEILKYAEIGLLYSNTCNLLDLCLSKLPVFISEFSLKYSTKDTSEGYKWISVDLALKIAEKCPRNNILTEDGLFKKLFEWATLYSPSFYKATMLPLLPFINFEKVLPLTLATTVHDNNLLSPEEYANFLTKAVIFETTNRKKFVFTKKTFEFELFK